MKNTKSLIAVVAFSSVMASCHTPKIQENLVSEKPIQHMKVSDITSESEAKKVMRTTTDQLKSKKKLDAVELHEIHVITYSLEKAIAYYVGATTGAQKATAEKMAEVVEEVHLNSENNRKPETKSALARYFALEKAFAKSM